MRSHFLRACKPPDTGPGHYTIETGAFLSHTSGVSSVSVPYPTGIQAGDLLVILTSQGSDRIASAPGWDLRGVATGYTNCLCKDADGTETGNVTVTFAGGITTVGGSMLRVRHSSGRHIHPTKIRAWSSSDPVVIDTYFWDGEDGPLATRCMLLQYSMNADRTLVTGPGAEYSLIGSRTARYVCWTYMREQPPDNLQVTADWNGTMGARFLCFNLD